jgi:hypothetical protein
MIRIAIRPFSRGTVLILLTAVTRAWFVAADLVAEEAVDV